MQGRASPSRRRSWPSELSVLGVVDGLHQSEKAPRYRAGGDGGAKVGGVWRRSSNWIAHELVSLGSVCRFEPIRRVAAGGVRNEARLRGLTAEGRGLRL